MCCFLKQLLFCTESGCWLLALLLGHVAWMYVQMINPVADALNIDRNRVFANTILFDERCVVYIVDSGSHLNKLERTYGKYWTSEIAAGG